VFITRASRHDRADVTEFLASQGEKEPDVSRGVTFIARDGAIVGCVRLVEVAPQTVVVDDVMVASDRRGEGIGGSLMRAAMNSRGGTLYLCCHEDVLGFYGGFGFTDLDPDDLPEAARAYFSDAGVLPGPEGHERHYFLKAR
jgi:N-acetylglutamate synthase-like GNAT family acetyltransferase